MALTLSQFGSNGSGDGEFNGPTDIVFTSNGHILVIDQFNHRVQYFDNTGTYLSKFGSSPGSGDGQFVTPKAIATTSNGDVLVVGGQNNRVQRFSLVAAAPASIPTLSEWGLIVLALSFMTMGTLYLVQPKFGSEFGFEQEG